MFSQFSRPVIAAGLLSVLSSAAMATSPDMASIGACACAPHSSAASASDKDGLPGASQALYVIRLTGLESVEPRGQSVVFETSLVSQQGKPVTFRSRNESYYLVSVTPAVSAQSGKDAGQKFPGVHAPADANDTLQTLEGGSQSGVPDGLDTGYSVTLTPLGVNEKGEVVTNVAFESSKSLKMRHVQVGDGADIPSPDFRTERAEQTVTSPAANPVTLHFGSHALVMRAERIPETYEGVR
jgi:hypothetical protein